MSTYSFMSVHASLTGPTGRVDMGYGAGVAQEGISVKKADDKDKMLVGADGEGMHSLSAAKHGTLTVRLLKTSPVNAKLMAMYNAQSIDQRLWGQNVIVINNPAGSDLVSARQVAFKKTPDLEYAEEGQLVEWEFNAIKIDEVLGTY